MPWSLNLSTDDAAETNSTVPTAVIKWHDYTSNGRIEHILSLSGQPIDRETLVEIARRVVGYRLVDRMPPEGLEELCTTIREMLEFYRSRVLPQRRAIVERRTIKGHLRTAIDPPAFAIDED